MIKRKVMIYGLMLGRSEQRNDGVIASIVKTRYSGVPRRRNIGKHCEAMIERIIELTK